MRESDFSDDFMAINLHISKKISTFVCDYKYVINYEI